MPDNNEFEKIFNDMATLIECGNDEISKENANMNADTPAGMMMKFASETSKLYTMQHLLSEVTKEYIKNGLIHVHDLDYYPTKSLTCVQHPLDKSLEGTRVGHCSIRTAKRIETASAVATIMLQGVQNEMHGGQSIPAFDFYLAPYVKTTYEEEIEKILKSRFVSEANEIEKYQKEILKIEIDEYISKPTDNLNEIDTIRQLAINSTQKRVHQAMESFIHNMNTMHSRGGNQVVFSSINYGTDTSPEGRCVMRELLFSTLKGVGNGETPIFPIQIMKLKKGINKKPYEPNYDLYELATKCTARRFYPNFLNLDAEYNQHELWDKNDPKRYQYEVATMGCRTRVFENINGDKTSIGRGNLSFTTINLPGLAFKAIKEEPIDTLTHFKAILKDTLDVVAEQLYERYQFQTTARKKQFPMLMNDIWIGSGELDNDDYVGGLLKQGTLGIGFIGLAECLILLTDEHKHHGESDKAQKLGLEIIEIMNKKVSHYKEKYELNYSVLATPAEGISGKFTRIDKNKYGIVENVTDKDYYTNSNHVPVWYRCTSKHKAEIEGEYHKLTPGGHIFYVEMDGNLAHNPEAINSIVQLMDKNEIGYLAINHSRNHCLNCGFENSEKELKVCPSCGKEAIDTIQRITGYLVGGTSSWNKYKKAELNDRVIHDLKLKENKEENQ